MGEPAPADDKPFNDEPFDAGVEADEQSDPKKYIEQLTGKLGQSLRKYNESQSEPDLELEKFAINSLLSATHTANMDQEDQEDIIKKVKESGNDDNQDNNKSDDSVDNNVSDDDTNNSSGGNSSNLGSDMGDNNSEDNSEINEEKEKENSSIFLDNVKKNNMFQIGSNDILKESCWKGYKAVGMKEKNGKQVPNCVPIDEALEISKKSSIFDKIKSKLHETFNQEEMIEPQIAPAPVKTPKTAPIAPSRKNRPFLPTPEVQPDPKAIKEGGNEYEIYNKTLSSVLDEAILYVTKKGYDTIEFDINEIQHINYGQTVRFQKELNKNGKPQKNALNIQIYRMDSGTYELNMYIS